MTPITKSQVKEIFVKIITARSRRRISLVLREYQPSILSSNCVGSRLSEISSVPYLSPTVGLWFKPADFLRFCENVEVAMNSDISYDPEESLKMGYPVGNLLGSIRIYFLHYDTFESARLKWLERCKRIRLDKILVVMTDRDGFSQSDITNFNKLDYPKILLSHKPLPQVREAVVVPVGNEQSQVGELYGNWPALTSALDSHSVYRIASELNLKRGSDLDNQVS